MNNLEERIKEQYKKFFLDEIDFYQLVGEINKIYKWFRGKSLNLFITPQLESQFYSNISKSLYRRKI